MRDRHEVDVDPGGAPWPILPPSMAPHGFEALPGVLWSRGAVSWYLGTAFALLWLIGVGQEVAANAASEASAALGIAVVILYGLAFAVSVPLGWGFPLRWRPAVVGALFALSFTLFPWTSWGLRGVWTYVGVTLGMMVLPWGITFFGILALALLAAWFGYLLDGWAADDFWIPVIVFSISLMMASFARTIAAMNELRATQRQLESMAVERERGRVARDIHDILGHSLTVITVKSELAGRLVTTDPHRAISEIAEVESLARGALADVRSTVARTREVNVSGELAAARSALAAAGIAAELSSSTDVIPVERRELTGWVVREGVTNVIRHSGATMCRVHIGTHDIEIADDGIGPSAPSDSATGLVGLRERVEAAGGRMSVGASDLGGFSLRVTL